MVRPCGTPAVSTVSITVNVYYNPEKFGLRIVGEIEWSIPCYSFDMTVVWQHINSGQFYWASDSGCSCPSPFESHGMDSLETGPPIQLQHYLEEQKKEAYDPPSDIDAQIVELMMKVVKDAR